MLNYNRRIVRNTLLLIASFLAFVVLALVSTRNSNAAKSIYTGTEDHVVSLRDARTWTSMYQVEPGSEKLVAGYFGRGIFEDILKQDRCVGIRIYNAKHDAEHPVFVLVGVDGSGKDMSTGTLGEGAFPCPPFCDSPSPLMSKQTEKPLASIAR